MKGTFLVFLVLVVFFMVGSVMFRNRNALSMRRGRSAEKRSPADDSDIPLSDVGANFYAYTESLIPIRMEAIRDVVVLLRTVFTNGRFEFRNFSALMIGWIGYMCDCAELMVHGMTREGLEDRAASWLRPIMEASILLHWVDEDDERAARALRSQVRTWRSQEAAAGGTVFERERFDAPPDLENGTRLPSTVDMARTLGSMEVMVFKLESEELHAGAGKALEYVNLDEEEIMRLRVASPKPGRVSGALGVALACLLKAGYEGSRRFGMGLEPQLAAIGQRAEVSPDFNAMRDDMWKEMWQPGSGFVSD